MKTTLVMIVKNEESNLGDCLATAADLVDEIVVVDTGSTDRTKEIAARYGARVFDFTWIDDFAAARNASLEHATGDWIFWLDADDRLDEENRARLKALLAGLTDEKAGYFMKYWCPANGPKAGTVVFDHLRLFRNDPAARWEYRIHEQIHSTLERLSYTIRHSDVTILHLGYQDEATRERKGERNLRLLELENNERPKDPFTLFNLGCTYQEIGRLNDAVSCYRRALRYARPQQSFVRKLYVMLTRAHRQLGQTGEAMAVCREGRGLNPHDPELLCQQAWLLWLAGDYQGAESSLLEIITGAAEDPGLAIGIDPGLRGYVTRHNLAVLYCSQNRTGEAEMQWRIAVTEQPDFAEAWLGLGELYLAQQRWDDLQPVLDRLLANPATTVEAAVLQAQQHLMRGQYAAGQELVRKAISEAPKAFGPRLVLARLLTVEGRDPAAATQAWREVLTLDANNKEAQQHLK
jgi:tetratricopeptide (TPR) repeat protein